MSYISCLNNAANLYSVKTFYPYTDKLFSYEVEDMASNYKGDYFYNAIDLLINLYKKELKKHILELNLSGYKYIVPIPCNISKFNNLNFEICKQISIHTDLEVLNDYFDSYDVPSVDIRDRYLDGKTVCDFKVNKKYKDYNVIFYDTFVSSGMIMDKISSLINSFPLFLNYFLRVDSEYLTESKITSTQLIDNDLKSNQNSGLVIKISNLFGKKEVVVDLRDDVAIIIGDNGIGKSTAYQIATLITSNNILSRIQLLKYYFEKIEVYYVSQNGDIYKKNSIQYSDLLPNKNALINITINKDFYLNHLYILDKQSGFNDISRISKVIEDVNVFLSYINEDEYKIVYRKILLNDFTYRYDISKLSKKYNIKTLDLDNVFIFLRHIVSLNKEFKESKSFILSSNTLYIDFSKSRYIKPYLPKLMMKNDHEFYEDFGYNLYNEDEQDSTQMFYDSLIESYESEEPEEFYENYENHVWDALIDATSDEMVDDYLEKMELDEIKEKQRIVKERFNLYFKLKWQIENYYAVILNNKYLFKQYDYCKILKNDGLGLPDFTDEEMKLLDSYMLDVKNALYNNSYKYRINNKNYAEIATAFNKDYYENLDLLNLYEFTNDSIDLNRIVQIVNEECIKNAEDFLSSLHLETYNDFNYKKSEIDELNYEIFTKRNNDLNFGILEVLSDEEKRNFVFSLQDGDDIGKINILFNIKKYFDEILPNCLDNALKKAEYIVNKYLIDKKIKIYPKNVLFLTVDGSVIPSSALSSGEKNIVIIVFISCLLNKIYRLNNLTFNQKDFNLILDEPDISMSLLWQEDLIEDIIYLLDADIKVNILTQSPQLVQNEKLHPYVYNLLDRKLNGNNGNLIESNDSSIFEDFNIYKSCQHVSNLKKHKEFHSSSDGELEEIFNELEFDTDEEEFSKKLIEKIKNGNIPAF